MKNFPFILILFSVFGVNSQSKQIQILDSLSKEPIPYTTVYFSNNKGLITDETGYFELLPEQVQDNDSLFVSFLGYDGLVVGLKKLKDSILYMTPKAIALEDVILTNKSYTSEKILALVKSKLEQIFAFRKVALDNKYGVYNQ